MYLKIIAVGNLGNKPELRYTPNGSAVCNFSVAVNNQYTAAAPEDKKEAARLLITERQVA